MVVNATYFSPSEDELYDFGIGVELQGRFPISDGLAFGLAAGFAGWEVEEQSAMLVDGIETLKLDMSGSASLLPIGVSLFFQPELSERLTMTFEGGLRYVLVNSSVDMDVEYFDGATVAVFKEELDIDNGFDGNHCGRY